mmetsp:Transcript_107687/g.291923  ORF Transcript_107687/g.291923 Transcript_107687/m.291923 type:complete len:117 (-) Transcript_107687:25-375(-)
MVPAERPPRGPRCSSGGTVIGTARLFFFILGLYGVCPKRVHFFLLLLVLLLLVRLLLLFFLLLAVYFLETSESPVSQCAREYLMQSQAEALPLWRRASPSAAVYPMQSRGEALPPS